MSKAFQTEAIRNVGLFGHRGCGKTSLAEAFLFNSGITTRLGSVDAKTSLFDFHEEEQNKGFTISATPGWVPWNDKKVNLIDTAGDLNFIPESRNLMGVVDLALFVVSATEGTEVGTEILWARADTLGMPRVVFVNKCDKERTDPKATLKDIKEHFSDSPVVAVHLPMGTAGQFEGIVDLLEEKAYRFVRDGSGKMEESDIPAEMADAVAEARENLMYVVAESDEVLAEHMLEDGELCQEELRAGFMRALKKGEVIPVLYGSATSNIGIQPLMNMMCKYGPNPLERKPIEGVDKEGNHVEVTPSTDGPFAAILFKIVLSRVGKFGIFRVFRGETDGSAELHNPNLDGTGRLGTLNQLQGKDNSPIDKAITGDIVGVTKMKTSRTGDSLVDPEHSVQFDMIHKPEPLLTYAIHASDEDKVMQGLHRLAEEDTSLILDRNPITHELLLSGQGQGHIDIIKDQLLHHFKQEITLTLPKIAYKETIRGSATNVEGKLKKQSGGRGQFAVCVIDMKPAEQGEGFVFEDGIVGGVIPKTYIPAVEKGIEEAAVKGVLSGCPTIDFHVRLHDGKTHNVDSSEQAFKMAGSFAFQAAVKECKPVLLEPYVSLRVTIPADHQGDISGDLNRRRGRIEETTYRGKNVTIVAKVPEVEVQTYANQLTSMTEGRGIFSSEFSHYEQVPPPVQKQIIDELKQEDES
ncbi:MAG: elongation factor G [Deltaproteobacteria bacterium]|nr:MAG: elongation factor G [Deltaproteobacteria bacterium]